MKFCVVALLVAFCSFASADLLTGKWVGAEFPRPTVWEFTFNDPAINATDEFDQRSYAGTYKFANSTTLPNTFNINVLISFPQQLQGQTDLGIFQIVEDVRFGRMRLAFAHPNSPTRPVNFLPSETNTVYDLFRR